MLKSKILCLLIFSIAQRLSAQSNPPPLVSGQNRADNPIATAVPFLVISPDARHGGMGDLGAATAPDANAVYWNPSKLVFAEEKMGLAVSHTPWLRNLVNDMFITYLSGYYAFKQKNGINAAAGASFRYFNLGELLFTNNVGVTTGQFVPREIAFDAFYALQLSKKFGMAVTLRYIYSNLAGSNTNNNLNSRPANSAAGDISAYWKNEFIYRGKPMQFLLGGNIANIGPKITYSAQSENDFIPTIMRLGFGLGSQLDRDNHLTFYTDFNKLLVPTPNPNKPAKDISLLGGIIGSFSDAPGGFKEEMREIFFSSGVEYSYQKKFLLRGGYFYESPYKGRRQYFTVGAGLRLSKFGIDFSYLTSSAIRGPSPLDNTIRFTMYLNIGEFIPDKPTTLPDNDLPPGEEK